MPGAPDRDDGPARAEPLPLIAAPDVLEMVPFDVSVAGLGPELRDAVTSGDGSRLFELYAGPLAGHELDAAIAGWQDLYTFVVVADLTLEQRLRHYPRHAAEWHAIAEDAASAEGASRSPRSLLAQATVLLLDDARRPAHSPGQALGRSAGVRFVEVGFSPQPHDPYVHFRIVKDGAPLLRISGGLAALRRACRPPRSDEALAPEDVSRFLGRLVEVASGGLVSSRSIALAFDLASPGDVTPARSEEGAAELAASLAASLASARVGDAVTADLGRYGTAHRVRIPGLTLPAVPRSRTRGAVVVELGGASGLVVPDEDVWVVAGLRPAAWQPVPSSPPTRPPRRRRWTERRAARVVLGVAAVLTALLVARHYRRSPHGAPCDVPRTCASRVCIVPFGEPHGYCSARCTTERECSNGLVCKHTILEQRLCMFPDGTPR